MISTTLRKFKIDIDEINAEAIEAAFGENRVKVNEDGLSNKALEKKQGVIAAQEAAKLFTRKAYACIVGMNGHVTHDDRKYVETIARNALATKIDFNDDDACNKCIEYLRGYCE